MAAFLPDVLKFLGQLEILGLQLLIVPSNPPRLAQSLHFLVRLEAVRMAHLQQLGNRGLAGYFLEALLVQVVGPGKQIQLVREEGKLTYLI